MTQNSPQNTQKHRFWTPAQAWFLVAMQLWGLFLLTLHLAASRLPEDTAWSVWPYTFLPPWLGWTLALLAGALIMPPVSRVALKGLSWLWQQWPAKTQPRRWFALAALLAGLVFGLARLRHLRWGDAYMLSVGLAWPDEAKRTIYNWQAPLTVFLHQRLWQFVAHPLWGWPVEWVYAAVSIGCGVVFVYLLLNFLYHLGRDALETALLAGLMLTAGAMQLFFGYVENYTVMSLGLLVTLYLAWRALRGEVRLVWPVLAFSITNAFHPSTVFLWPGVLVLPWLCWRRRRVSLTEGLWQTILPPLLVGGSVFALMSFGGHGLSALMGSDQPGGGDGLWFVPLFTVTTQWQHYTMFSTAHLLDWANEHLLISPFGLPLIILALIGVYRFRLTLFDKAIDRDYAWFLGAVSTVYVLFTWVWNADYGGRNDWDLFAPSAWGYTLLAGFLLVRIMPDRERLKAGGLWVVVVSFLHTAAWIFTNTHVLPR